MLHQAAIEVQGETDAPVTTDIHRLIRLPNSLHGGSGLRVVPIEIDRLDGFDPLRDAFAPGLTGDAVPLEILETIDYRLAGASVAGSRGDRIEVAPGIALFLVLRGEAALRP